MLLCQFLHQILPVTQNNSILSCVTWHIPTGRHTAFGCPVNEQLPTGAFASACLVKAIYLIQNCRVPGWQIAKSAMTHSVPPGNAARDGQALNQFHQLIMHD